MSKFCPKCESEFLDTIPTCPKDKIRLVEQLSADDVMVDFYLAHDQIEAERIVSYLRTEGIWAKESDRGISQLPVESDKKFVVLIPRSKRDEARKFIEQARQDHVISLSGAFI
ncbi:MAG: hypothetical protein KC505_08100 [Myxococcales bacterium]|nr:hypothetical protein [Myxococcales bacterium]USN51428.1 MAG: hypothetical protein H6731_03200 [Myxococcales bacterium]